MNRSKKNRSRRGTTQLDAAESFNRALEKSRISRGEPGGGVSRSLWESRRWAEEHRGSLIAGALAALGLTVAGAVLAQALAESGALRRLLASGVPQSGQGNNPNEDRASESEAGRLHT